MVEQILDVFYYNVTNDGLSLDSFSRKIDENDLKNLDFADLNKSDFDKYYNELGFLKVNPELIRSNDYIYNYAHYSKFTYKIKIPNYKTKRTPILVWQSQSGRGYKYTYYEYHYGTWLN